MADDPSKPKQDAPPEGLNDASGENKRSGRVAYDSRGNPIWEWQLETGIYSRDPNTQKLKKLDLGELSIAETGLHKKPGFKNPASAGGGFDPYDTTGTPKEGLDPYDKMRTQQKNAVKPEPPKDRSPPRSPDELRRLGEWLRMKRETEKKAQEEED